ncbi:MAG: 3-oxoacyl-ACP reductase FabG [Planctomycetes bacterium]|nr:3-oxoacyl-ACP reductase FabG [Planctomycetota bacterium]MCL4728825.1 3-oxoacyl-ACP reductase FabG [Planctomycetota bacterium]
MSPIALVTGASRGIGRAIAARLARDGCRVWVNYAGSTDAAQSLVAEITQAGGSARALQFNVADGEQCAHVLEAMIEEEGGPEIVVSNAGITKDGLMAMMSANEWRQVIETNLGGFFNVVKPCLRPMLRRRSGRIIAISSVSGEAGNAGQVNYSASKAGLIGACKALAKEIASRKVTVNVVAPGFVETDMVKDLPKEELAKQVPLGRFGTADEVAAAVSFLAGREAGYITGQVLGINGGMYM